ncbi:MAG: hypothetical protein J3K34DRAFT_462935 [Monoraphidium minutum]|nr:MAG: hypothetical protein J3K34DRAFT_462935 [Monoraphidium minutum]
MAAARRFSAAVAVVGAGQAGLVVARELLKEGHRVTVFEAGPGVGGTWNVAPAPEADALGLDPARRRVHSSMYPGLRTNLPRHLMSYLDVPFVPEAMGAASHDARLYPLHTEARVLAFLEAYADGLGLRNHVRLNTAVVRLDPIAVAAGGGSGATASGAAAFAAANGATANGADAGSGDAAAASGVAHKAPAAAAGGGAADGGAAPPPPWGLRWRIPGMREWPGQQVHSHSFRGGAEFKGQRVMVVPMLEALLPCGPARLAGGGGAVEGLDAIVYCTGYAYALPLLDHLGLADTSARPGGHHVRPLFLHMFPPAAAPSLALVGLSWRASRPPQFQLQGQLLARLLSGAAGPLPPAGALLAAAAADLRALDAAGIPRRYAHCMASFMPQDEWAYAQALVDAARPRAAAADGVAADVATGSTEARAAGCGEGACGGPEAPPLLEMPAWMVALAKASSSDILERPDSFRDVFLEQLRAALPVAEARCGALLLHGDGARVATAAAKGVRALVP